MKSYLSVVFVWLRHRCEACRLARDQRTEGWKVSRALGSGITCLGVSCRHGGCKDWSRDSVLAKVHRRLDLSVSRQAFVPVNANAAPNEQLEAEAYHLLTLQTPQPTQACSTEESGTLTPSPQPKSPQSQTRP